MVVLPKMQCKWCNSVVGYDVLCKHSLRYIHHPEVDAINTCVWTNWLRMIARYRLRMTDAEKSQLKKQIQRRQAKRRFRRLALQPSPEEPLQVTTQEVDNDPTTLGLG